MAKIKICIFGIFYPLAMLSYFREAFEHRDDVELYTCGPFTGNWIPWGNGMTLPMKYVYTPTLALPRDTIRISPSYRLVRNSLPKDLDLAFCIDAGWHFCDRPEAKTVALVKTDPHAIPESHYAVPEKYSDVVFNMQQFYSKLGEIHLPYAYSPRIHFHEDREKVYDACLIGLHYDTRNQLVKRLRDRGLNIYYSLGEVYDAYREKYNQSRIALSWSSKEDLPARVWEAFAMRLPLVANTTQEMSQFFCNGEHYLGFNNVDEAEQQVMTLLNDKKFRDEMAQKGYENVKSETWDKRVQTVLERCGLV